MIIFLLLATMQKTNEDAIAFGETRNKNMLQPNTAENTALLSEARTLEENEIPKEGDPIDSDTNKMLKSRQTNKSDPISTDKLVTEILDRGDKVVQDPEEPIQINAINSPEEGSIIHTCIESIEPPKECSFFRILRPNITIQPCVEEKVCTRLHKHCTGASEHSDDHPECTQYEEHEGYTVPIPVHESCDKFGWWKYRPPLYPRHQRRTSHLT